MHHTTIIITPNTNMGNSENMFGRGVAYTNNNMCAVKDTNTAMYVNGTEEKKTMYAQIKHTRSRPKRSTKVRSTTAATKR